jgi:hypothetical protein
MFATEQQLQGLRSLFQTLGGALLGATAIVSSLVLFAMQVNVERMPHGLFRRLSADYRLLGAFAAAFALAVFVAALSLIPNKGLVGFATFSASWATLLILVLYLYGYRRALILINPLRQLGVIVARTGRDLRVWVRRANRSAPLFTDTEPSAARRDDHFASTHDFPRVHYFQANPHWTDSAKQAVRYAASLARRYAEQGDHEVSAAATNAIIAINAGYVQAKEKTFFTYNFMVENPLTSDSFITDTLELVRQTGRIAISREDEQQIEQTLRAFAELVRIYAGIDYGSPHASKTHAHLAAEYLTGEIEHVVPHNMPDVLMEGARLVGRCADILLSAEGPNGTRTLTEKLGIIGCYGVAKEDHRPVTSTCVEQLARLSFNLLRTRSQEVKFAAAEVRRNVELLAKLVLAIAEGPLTRTHSTVLGGYYSATSSQALTTRLAELVNATADASGNNEDARQIIRNIEAWADGIYRTDKKILLEAVKRRSQFTFDAIHWISSMTSLLLAASNTSACDRHTRDRLRQHALWLISVLSFVPDDLDTVQFVETFQMTETLFEAALDAHRRSCPDIAAAIADLLVWWMFEGGQYHSGWAILERSVYGLAVLALLTESDGGIARIKVEVGKRVASGGLSDQTVRDEAALEIRGRAATLYRKGRWTSSIEAGMARADHAKLKPLLEELADLISPGTAGQAARQPPF